MRNGPRFHSLRKSLSFKSMRVERDMLQSPIRTVAHSVMPEVTQIAIGDPRCLRAARRFYPYGSSGRRTDVQISWKRAHPQLTRGLQATNRFPRPSSCFGPIPDLVQRPADQKRPKFTSLIMPLWSGSSRSGQDIRRTMRTIAGSGPQTVDDESLGPNRPLITSLQHHRNRIDKRPTAGLAVDDDAMISSLLLGARSEDRCPSAVDLSLGIHFAITSVGEGCP